MPNARSCGEAVEAPARENQGLVDGETSALGGPSKVNTHLPGKIAVEVDQVDQVPLGIDVRLVTQTKPQKSSLEEGLKTESNADHPMQGFCSARRSEHQICASIPVRTRAVDRQATSTRAASHYRCERSWIYCGRMVGNTVPTCGL